jgi:hypothetical protein
MARWLEMARRLLLQRCLCRFDSDPGLQLYADVFESHRLFDTAAWLSGLKLAIYNRLMRV